MKKKAGRNAGTRAVFMVIAAVCCWFLCMLPALASGISDPDQTADVQCFVNASPVRYGQRLKESVLEGTATDQNGVSVSGVFTWKEPEKAMQKIGEVMETAVFTPEDGKSDPVLLNVSVTVRRGAVTIKEYPEIICSGDVYDKDTPGEVLKLRGNGLAVCVVSGKDGDLEETVPGKFGWKEPDQELRTGKQSPELLFTPADPEKYEPETVRVEIEVNPRPVDLKLELSDTTIKQNQEIVFTASVEKSDKLQQLEGNVHFFVDGKEAAKSGFSDNGSKLQAKASWRAEKTGTYKVYALYMPENDRTAQAKSGEKAYSVVTPLSAITTESLPAGRAGKEYQASLLTDASGKFPLKYSLEDGSLPEGLLLENDGTIKGTPQEAGEFVFTVSVSEGKDKASREFHLQIEEKLTFSLKCGDTAYGETVSASMKVLPEAHFQCSYTFEGRNETAYDGSKIPPVLPGDYRVKALIEEPADYAGQEIFCDFTIKKAAPKLKVTAAPSEWKGEKDCTISIEICNPADPEWKENLPTDLTVHFDKEVEVRQPLQGAEGKYTLIFRAGKNTETIRCSVLTSENDCYEQSESYVDVSVSADGGSGNGQVSGNDGNHTDDKKKNEEPAKRQETDPEPVIKTPEEVEAEFWQDVIFRIYDAQKLGDTVTINAKGHGSMPDKVLEALRQHEKVTLALVWEGDMILIPAGKAPAPDKAHRTWTLGELSLQYGVSKTTVTQDSQNKASEVTAPAKRQESSHNADKNTAETENRQEETGEIAEEAQEAEPVTEEETEEEPEGIVPENTILTEKVEDGGIDWFLVAGCVCAGCGIIIVAIAIWLVVHKRSETERKL